MTGKRAAACTTENKPFAKRLCSLMVECGENQKELAEEHRQADAIDQQKIESKIQAIETVKALMEM